MVKSARTTRAGLILAMAVAAVLLLPSTSRADKWLLTHLHLQNAHTSSGGLVEFNTSFDNGAFASNIGVTNQFNPNSGIFGTTNHVGNLRFYFQTGHDPYDFQIVGPPGTERTPGIYQQYVMPDPGNYTFEAHFRRVVNDAEVTTYPLNPVYHWDHIRSLNTAGSGPGQLGSVPPEYNSGAFEQAALWQNTWGQTFVVPQGINRIISAKGFAAFDHCVPAQLRFTIHHNTPNGAQVGPAAITNPHHGADYGRTVAHWDTNAVQVVPGQTYALRVEKVDQGAPCYASFSMMWTPHNANAYPNGTAWVSNWTQQDGHLPPSQVAARDLCAVVIGVGVNLEAGPTFTPTSSPTHTNTPVPTSTPTHTFTATPPLPDADGDGVPDHLEGWPPAAGQTNRYFPDTDRDGLSDGVEDANRNGVRDAGETDGRNPDSDGDGFEDGMEKLVLNSNPLNAASPGASLGPDADGDGVPALFDTNDNNPDVDGDRYKDGFEMQVLSYAAANNANIHPSMGDISGDGVITNLDALITQALFLNLVGPQDYIAQDGDINRDGAVTNLDALITQGFFLGMVPLLPM